MNKYATQTANMTASTNQTDGVHIEDTSSFMIIVAIVDVKLK